jgi:hypothetical protein
MQVRGIDSRGERCKDGLLHAAFSESKSQRPRRVLLVSWQGTVSHVNEVTSLSLILHWFIGEGREANYVQQNPQV